MRLTVPQPRKPINHLCPTEDPSPKPRSTAQRRLRLQVLQLRPRPPPCLQFRIPRPLRCPPSSRRYPTHVPIRIWRTQLRRVPLAPRLIHLTRGISSPRLRIPRNTLRTRHACDTRRSQRGSRRPSLPWWGSLRYGGAAGFGRCGASPRSAFANTRACEGAGTLPVFFAITDVVAGEEVLLDPHHFVQGTNDRFFFLEGKFFVPEDLQQ